MTGRAGRGAMLGHGSKRAAFNSKRRIRVLPVTDVECSALAELAGRVGYVGSALHKCNTGDFGLLPPAAPRPGKTLCDNVVPDRRRAQELLAAGVERGLVSVRTRGEWPQNVWAVADNNVAVEAQLDNEMQGTYHGYPMPEADPLRDEVLRRWQA